jgi:hypothetical protein
VALLLAAAGFLVLPAAIEVSRRSKSIGLLQAGYAIPLAFLLGLISLIMARRARHNLRWLRLQESGTRVATTALAIATITLCVSAMAALSVGFYGLVVIYQHSR